VFNAAASSSAALRRWTYEGAVAPWYQTAKIRQKLIHLIMISQTKLSRYTIFPFPVIFIFKICQIIVSISMISQFHEFHEFNFWLDFAFWPHCTKAPLV